MKLPRYRDWFALVLSSLVACSALMPVTAKSSSWDANIKQGRACLQQGDYDQANRLFQAALDDSKKFKDNDPRMALTFHSMADLNLRLENYSLAKEYYERALAGEQKIQGAEGLDVADDLYGLALCNQQMGDHLAAEIFLKRVDEIWRKKLGPKNPQLLSILPAQAAYASMKNNLAYAETCYRQIVDIKETQYGKDSPKVGSDLNLLATTLGNEGKLAEAKEVATRAVSLLKDSGESSVTRDSAQDNLIVIEAKVTGQLKEKAVESSETSTKTSVAITQPPVETVKPASGEDATSKVIASTEPANSSSSSSSSSSLIAPKPWETDRTIKKNDGVGGESQRSKQWGKVRYLAEGRLISSEEYKAMLLASQAYEMMKQEKYRLAVDLLNKALDEYPDLASAHTNIGLALCRMGKNDQAIGHLKTAIALDPDRSAPWLNLASGFQNEGRLKESLETYNEYLKRFPKDSLASKARELTKHLQEEINEQDAVEKQMIAGKNQGQNDYLPYTITNGTLKWTDDKMPIKVYMANGKNVPGYQAQYEGLLLDAFRQWSDASKGKIKFEFVNKPELANVDCLWSNDVSQVGSSTEGGEAQISWTEGGIDHAKIVLLTLDPTPDSPLSQNQMRAVCLHEVGHALGLIGHSPRTGDIMYCSMPSAESKPAISGRDGETLCHLYAPDVVIALKPKSGLRQVAGANTVIASSQETDSGTAKAYAQSIEKLEEVLKSDPDNQHARADLIKAYNRYAQELADKGQFKEAESFFQKALNVQAKLKNLLNKTFTVDNYSAFLRKQKRDREAERLEAQFKQSAEGDAR